MPYESLTPQGVCDALGEQGLPVAPADVVLERREGRWMARLPGGRLAWFAATDAAAAALALERRLLRLLAVRCGFGVPRVLLESTDGAFDVRSMVPGTVDPWAVHVRIVGDADAARRLGAGIGAVLADLHTSVRAADAAGWLPVLPDWPASRASIADRLPRVVADPHLHARADEVMARYEALQTPDEDRVLVHTDLGFHNLGLDPETLAVRGVFDWETACWADRHLDFRHLVMGTDGEPLLDAAIAAYEPAAGRTLSRARILLHNAAVAIGFLAYRDGVEPDVRWCGRTLDEDLAWTRRAIAGALDSCPAAA